MRRWIVGMAIAGALVGALAVGPFGAVAAAPYVYGCTPAAYYYGSAYSGDVVIYNGSATTSNVTMKVLTGDGTIRLSSPLVIPATKTNFFRINIPPNSAPHIEDSTFPATVRLVSNVPVAATYTHEISAGVNVPIYCSPLLP